MCLNQIINFLIFFDLCGFNTGSSNLSKNGKSKIFIFVVHILIAIYFSTIQFHWFFVNYYASLTLNEALSELIQYLAALFSYWLIILDSYSQSKKHQHFWQTLQKIDKQFSCKIDYTFRIYLVKCIEFFTTILLTVFSCYVLRGYEWNAYDVPYFGFYQICHIRAFYYVFCLKIINFQLKVIENEVKIMKNIINSINMSKRFSDTYSNYYVFELQRLKWIRRYFNCVNDMIACLNEIFGWSQVAVILFCLYLCVSDLNWFYIHYILLDQKDFIKSSKNIHFII